jgi:hypothetical protein
MFQCHSKLNLAKCPPVSIDIVVVFPAPLCPRSAVICPSYILNETLSTANLLLPNRFVRFLTTTPAVRPGGSGSKPGWSSVRSESERAESIRFQSTFRFRIHVEGWPINMKHEMITNHSHLFLIFIILSILNRLYTIQKETTKLK